MATYFAAKLEKMKSSDLKDKSNLYLIPYFVLLIIGVWYRYSTSGLAYLDGDSEHYLMPPVIKALTGEWHKGERPMQYLLFIYATLSEHSSIKYTIIAQQVLGICSGALLSCAWVSYVRTQKAYKLLWHLLGYMVLGIYISSPMIMNYEEFIGPESICMFIMSTIIFCLTVGFSGRIADRTKWIFISIAIFLNLYLFNPLPKWAFVTLFLELVLLYQIIKTKTLTTKSKIYLTVVPHLLFVLLVMVPEATHKIDNADEDRVYIEYEQMVYTHFDLLAQDKSNFDLPPALQDSMVRLFNESKGNDYPLLGFCSDNLMWGRANQLIYEHFQNHFDSIRDYFIDLNRILIIKYPWQLAKQIWKQVYSFYFSTQTVSKDLYGFYNVHDTYPPNLNMIQQFDKHILDHTIIYPGFDSVTGRRIGPGKKPEAYYLTPHYPLFVDKGSLYDIERLPLIFSKTFIFYTHFQIIFILALFLFFAVRLVERKLFELDIITLLYCAMFVYVLTIAIVHSFDIQRFTSTIYPLMLITPCLAIGYIGTFILDKIKSVRG